MAGVSHTWCRRFDSCRGIAKRPGIARSRRMAAARLHEARGKRGLRSRTKQAHTETETTMIAEGIKYVRRASPLVVSPTPEIRRALHPVTPGARTR